MAGKTSHIWINFIVCVNKNQEPIVAMDNFLSGKGRIP